MKIQIVYEKRSVIFSLISFFFFPICVFAAKPLPLLSLPQLQLEREKNTDADFSRYEIYGEAWVVNSSPSLGKKKILLVSSDPFTDTIISHKNGAFYFEIPKLPASLFLYPGQKLNIRGKITEAEENEFLETTIFTLGRSAIQILSVEPKSLVLPKTFSIGLERQICAGDCPHYKVSIDQSGLVRFEGKEHVVAKGMKTKTIPIENVKRLWELVEKINFFALSEKYHNEVGIDKGSPLYLIQIKTAEKSKTISHEEGNPKTPIKLIVLENAIDELLQTESWIR